MMALTTIYAKVPKGFPYTLTPSSSGSYDGTTWTPPTGWTLAKAAVVDTHDNYYSIMKSESSDGGTTWSTPTATRPKLDLEVPRVPVQLSKDGTNFFDDWDGTGAIEYVRFLIDNEQAYSPHLAARSAQHYLQSFLSQGDVVRRTIVPGSYDLESVPLRYGMTTNGGSLRIGAVLIQFGRLDNQDLSGDTLLTVAFDETFGSVAGIIASMLEPDAQYNAYPTALSVSSATFRVWRPHGNIEDPSLRYLAWGTA